MRFSALATTTSRERPRGARSRGQELLHRGGFVRPLSQGLYSYLPLGFRVLSRLTRVIRREMEELGGQEVLLPVVNPLDLWSRTGRDEILGDEMIRFRDRSGKTLVLSPTHEEAAVELVKSIVASYRDLPVFIYQFQTKYRNEMKTRGGTLRTREFVMKDGYSFHRSATELNNFIPKIWAAYERIFRHCRVPYLTAQAANGVMMGERSFEFLMPFEHGDDSVISCPACGYAANRDVAVAVVDVEREPPADVEIVETGDDFTMSDLATRLEVPQSRLGKTMVYSSADTVVLAVVRGDQQVSEEKLAGATGIMTLRRSSRDEILAFGLNPEDVSPLDLPADLLELDMAVHVVVDHLVARTPNLIFPANEHGYRVRNVNFGRDFDGDQVADVSRVIPGARCTQCGTALMDQRAIELGHIFRIGTHYSRSLKLSLVDSTRRTFHPALGAYGIGVGRLMAAVAEANADKRGIAWPHHLAPYYVLLMGIGKSPTIAQLLDSLHDELAENALLDDRPVSISTKFRDADLIGIPFRVIVGPRAVESGYVELLERGSTHVERVRLDDVHPILASRTGGFP
jgi:prolyl-tRNA synthetase